MSQQFKIKNFGENQECYNYLTNILNIKANIVKLLFKHNEYFFENDENINVLCNLLNNKCALGEKDLGSSIYKRYCSDLNHIINKIFISLENKSVPKYIKMVKDLKINDKLEWFLNNEIKLSKGRFFKKFTKKERKQLLFNRLKIKNENLVNNSFFEYKNENTGVQKSASNENIVVVVDASSIKKSFLEAVKTENVDYYKNVIDDKVNSELQVPKYIKQEFVDIKTTKVDLMELYLNNRRRIKPSQAERIDSFLELNALDSPEKMEEFRIMLNKTRNFRKVDFIKEERIVTYRDNSEEIESIKNRNEKVAKLKERSISEWTKFINKNKVGLNIINGIKNNVKNHVKSMQSVKDFGDGSRIEYNLKIENGFDILENIETDEDKSENSMGYKCSSVLNYMNNNGFVNSSLEFLGKKATKTILENSKSSEKNVFRNPELKIKKVFSEILNRKISFSNKKICNKIFKNVNKLTKQIVRRVKNLSVALKKYKEIIVKRMMFTPEENNPKIKIIVENFKELGDLFDLTGYLLKSEYAYYFVKESIESSLNGLKLPIKGITFVDNEE